MADLFDYLQWRGDLPFSQVPFGPVDALLLSALVYIRFDEFVPESLSQSVSLPDAAKKLEAHPDPLSRCRVKNDLALLSAAAKSRRFGTARLCGYRNIFLPAEDTQFAAVTILTDDGNACVSFRGTDNTLVGWKEDFNMTFSDSVPAQRLAASYLEEVTSGIPLPIVLTGHSKGGNLAVFAAATAEKQIQERILDIYNEDGPGFLEHITESAGYQQILPKIHTYVPQSSVVGLLLGHKEAYTIVHSKQVGIMQHDPYTWEVLGPDFIKVDSLTVDSRFLEQTFRGWIQGMAPEERNAFFDTLFGLLQTEDATHPRDIMKPGNLMFYLRTLYNDERMRKTISREFSGLLHAARDAQAEMLGEEKQP